MESTSASSATRISTDAWVEDSSNGFAFKHPSEWRFYPGGYAFSMTTVTGFLSNAALNSPCQTSTPASGGLEESCGSPVDRLSPGDVLITVGGGDGPTTGVPTPAPNASVGQQPAVLTSGPVSSPDECKNIGGSYEMHILSRPDLSGTQPRIQFTACFAGGDSVLARDDFQQL